MKQKPPESDDDKVRLDKWLWAARFFKHRNLAKEAIDGGKVLYNGQRAKPGREVEVGAQIRVRKPQEERTVVVTALSIRRGPASEAALLYQETEESREERARMADLNRTLRMSQMPPARRPNKRDRRLIHQFNEKQNSDS